MYSNCLFEALKAKLKDPKHVQIIHLPRSWNDGHSHYLWIKDNQVYHFEAQGKHLRFFFKGKLKSQSLEAFESFILHKNSFAYKADKIDFAKKLHLPSTKEIGFLEWGTYFPNDGYTEFPRKNRICRKIIVSDSSNISTMLIDEATKDNLCNKYWKYLSPYTDMWITLHSSERK